MVYFPKRYIVFQRKGTTHNINNIPNTTPLLTASDIKYLQSLRLGKFRQKYNKFVAEGDKCCVEFLKTQRYNIDTIYASKDWESLHIDILTSHSSKVTIVDAKEMKKISQLKTPTDVLLLCDKADASINKSLNADSILYLDGIQNPGNLGTIIRTADWYGISQLVCSKDTVDFYHPKVVQAAMGSHNRMTYFVADLSELITISNHKVLGTALDGLPIDRSESLTPCILVIGNEGQGIRKENMEFVDHKILITGSADKIAESLNAGIATAIVLDRLFG